MELSDNTAILLALGATAVAGFVALSAASKSAPVIEEVSKPKRRSRRKPKREDEPTPTLEASADEASAEETSSPKTSKKKKKKRKHKGRKKKGGGGKKAGREKVVDDLMYGTEYEDDGKNTDSWETIVAKPKTVAKPAENGGADDTAASQASYETMALGDKTGAVVGKGGSKIRQIQDDSGAKLDIDRESSTLKITGTPEQIAIAKSLVGEAIGDRGDRGRSLRDSAPCSATVALGTSAGRIIGSRGATIQGIQSSTDTNVDIKRNDDGTADAVVRGQTDEAVADAVQQIEDILAGAGGGGGGGRGSRDNLPCSATVALGTSAGRIIGSRGATIQGIQSSTGTFVDIKRNDDGTADADVKGQTDEAVADAVQQIEDILANAGGGGGGGFTGGNSVTMELGSRQAKFTLIGKGGKQIMALQDQSGARLSVDKQSNSVTISGSDEAIEAAEGLISALLSSCSAQEEMQITSDNIGAIIGKGGSTIRRIETETSASLRINRDDLTLTITGSDDAVASASAMVTEILDAPREARGSRAPRPLADGEVEAFIDLENSVGSVIGKGGSTIQRLQDESGARLDIERGSSNCRITGQPDEVEDAKQAVQEILDRSKEFDAKREAARDEASESNFNEGGADAQPAAEGDGDIYSPEGW